MGYIHTYMCIVRYSTTQCDVLKKKKDPVISFFSVCPLLIIFFSLCSPFARHLLMAKESIWLCKQLFICVPKSIWPYCARSFSVGDSFFYNDDRSINQIEWSAFVCASPQQHHIESNTRTNSMASFFFFFHTCRIVYHWAQLNGFTLQFSRKNNILQNLKMLNLFIYRSTNRFGSIRTGSRHFWNGDFILIARTPKNRAQFCVETCSLNNDVIRKNNIKRVKIIVIFFSSKKKTRRCREKIDVPQKINNSHPILRLF